MSLNVWNKEDFAMCSLGEKFKLLAKLKHVKKNLKYSKQRITRGYSDRDVWNVDYYLRKLIPDMLQQLKDTRHGSPSYLGKDYVNRSILCDEKLHLNSNN